MLSLFTIISGNCLSPKLMFLCKIDDMILYDLQPSHCTGLGPGMGQGTMGFYIMLCTIHTTQGQGWGPGMGLGSDGFQTHFTTGSCTGHRFLLFPVTLPVLQCVQYTSFPILFPVPFPVPVPCSVNEPLQEIW